MSTIFSISNIGLSEKLQIMFHDSPFVVFHCVVLPYYERDSDNIFITTQNDIMNITLN